MNNNMSLIRNKKGKLRYWVYPAIVAIFTIVVVSIIFVILSLPKIVIKVILFLAFSLFFGTIFYMCDSDNYDYYDY